MSLSSGPNRRRLRFEQLELRCLLSANPGDFSGNGLVDAADYVLWRKGDPRADSNGDNQIDQTDYTAWRSNFGNAYAPGAFQITGPNHLLTNDNFTIAWEASSGASSYRLTLSHNADGSVPVFTETLTSNSRTFNNFGDTTVYVSVAAINAAGDTAASNQNYFVDILLPSTPQVLFVTSDTFYIDPFHFDPPNANEFGSAATADYQATNFAANFGGLLAQPWDGETIHYRALVTETLESLDDMAGLRNERYLNTHGDIIAMNHADLFDGTLSAPILDENGNAVTSGPNSNYQFVWTGANADGSWSGHTASNWSSINSDATVGTVNGSGTTWLSNGTRASVLAARLYAVGDLEVPFGSFTTIQRSGSADPTTQGFPTTTFYGAPSNVGPIANDSGHAAWSIAGTGQSSQFGYATTLSTANNFALRDQGFIMTFDARAIQGLAPAYDAINHVAVANAKVDVNNRRFEVALGIDGNGDTVVILPSSIDSGGPGGSLRTPGSSYTLVGSGSSWHNYQLVYDPTVEKAYLLVDGVRRLQNYAGHTSFVSNNFNFSAFSGGQGNFDSVKLELLWPTIGPGAGASAGLASNASVVRGSPDPASATDRRSPPPQTLLVSGATAGLSSSVSSTRVNAPLTAFAPTILNNQPALTQVDLLTLLAARVDNTPATAIDDAHSLTDDRTTEQDASPDSLTDEAWDNVAAAISL